MRDTILGSVFDFGTCLIFTRKVSPSNCAKLLAVPFQFRALNSLKARAFSLRDSAVLYVRTTYGVPSSFW